MVIQQKMHSLQLVLKSKARIWAATSLVILVLVGTTSSNPVEPSTSVDQASDSEIPPGYVPTALLAKYYGNMYNDQEEANVEKRTPLLDNEEGQHIARYIQKRSQSNANRYWNLLRALEEELALEGMARQGIEDDEPIANEAEPVDDVHKVDKRRRRYGFWVTAINKMDHGNLRGFLGKHRNIYNVYKRQAPNSKWIPRALHPSST